MTHIHKVLLYAVVFVFAFALADIAYAQSSGTVDGVVKDSSDSAVPAPRWKFPIPSAAIAARQPREPAEIFISRICRSHGRMLKIKPTDRHGNFQFTWHDARFDYEIYAEREDVSSEKVLISGNPKKPEVVVNLKLAAKPQ